VLVSCVPGNRQNIQDIANSHTIQLDFLGRTGGDRLVIQRASTDAVSAYVRDLKNVWAGALESALHSDMPDHLVPDLLDK
jgi:hypothetical protein